MKYSISERILDGSRALWDEYYAHPFVLGIANGTLSLERFRYFMIQDYLYLIEYAKVFAIGSAKSTDMDIMKAFSGYATSIQSGEMDIHRGYMKKLGIDIAEAEKAVRSLDNLSYTSYMLRIAYEAGPAEICAAILPCAVSYEDIAKRMVDENPRCAEHPFFGDWINGYACEAYHNENDALMQLTEKAAAGYSEEQINTLVEIGHICSLYEKAFWDMSWEMRR